MQQYEINGKARSEPIECKHCQGGKVFENQIFLKIDCAESEFAEPICAICGTKYKIKKEELTISIPEEYTPSNPEYFVRDRAVALIENVMEEMEEAKMNYAEELVKFQETGLCSHPKIVQSNKVKTADGEFVFNACVVCKQATVDYKGKTYKGTLSELVSWVAQKGIEADKQMSKIPDSIDELGLKEVEQIDVGSMFKDEEEEVSFF